MEGNIYHNCRSLQESQTFQNQQYVLCSLIDIVFEPKM